MLTRGAATPRREHTRTRQSAQAGIAAKKKRVEYNGLGRHYLIYLPC